MASQTLDDEGIDALEASVRGDVIRPGDDDYDDARAVWNGLIDRRPALIARCTGVDDVRAALAVAREHDLPVTVRGGGHNVAGTAVCDDGLVVDLSSMREVRVDPAARTARVQGGSTWADVDEATQAHGLATPGGAVSATGVAGLTLGGGLGHLRGAYGLSCDNLRSAEVVTAAGDRVVASADENPELFWGLRGGGGGLGVVTDFEFDLHPVGPEVATCLVFYPGERLEPCLRAYREYVASAPAAVSTMALAGVLPDEELFEAAVVDEPKLAIVGCHAGRVDDGERALAPLRELDEPIADLSGPMPYVELQRLFDADYPDGMRYYWKSLYLEDLPDAAVERVAHWSDVAPSPLSTVDVWQLGGAIAAVDDETSAFPGRQARYLLGVEANWERPADDDANVAWVRECIDDMRRFSDGSVYLNFPGFFEGGAEELRTTFGSTYDRLVALQAEYDPTNRFGPDRRGDPSGRRHAEGSGVDGHD